MVIKIELNLTIHFFFYLFITALAYGYCGGFGITAGAHRLFAHKAYKANKALKVLMLYFQTIAFQNSVFEWARDHRFVWLHVLVFFWS